MAVFCPTVQEAQTAAGVRGRAFLPKTARRAPQALEAGAFWDHRPKSLPSHHTYPFGAGTASVLPQKQPKHLFLPLNGFLLTIVEEDKVVQVPRRTKPSLLPLAPGAVVIPAPELFLFLPIHPTAPFPYPLFYAAGEEMIPENFV